MALTKADIDQLNTLAGVLGDVGDQIDGIQILAAVAEIRAALPGCPVPDACARAGDDTEYALLRVADRFRSTGVQARSTAADLQATDDTLAQRLAEMAFQDGER